MPVKRLAVISDPLDAASSKGLLKGLGSYFNPAGFFDEVYLISPMEKWRASMPGFEIIPARDIQLPQLLRELNIDVCRAYGGKWALEMAVFFRAQGVPVVVSIHDRRPEMLCSAVKWADIVLCVSKQVRQQVLKKYPFPERVWLRPNGVDLSSMKPLDSLHWTELDRQYVFDKVILHVGRKSPEKNIALLITALRDLPAGVGLVMIGPGDDLALRSLAAETGVLNRCVFIETVQNYELPAYYNWADCFCLPSFDEAMSNVVLEAMACGCPSVLSSAAAAGVGVEPGREALVFDACSSSDELARQIARVISEPILAQSLKDNAFLKVAAFDQQRTSRMEAEQYGLILEMRERGEFERSFSYVVARKADQLLTRVLRVIRRGKA